MAPRLVLAALVASFLLVACSIFNLGGTGEGGEPKTVVTAADAVQVVTSFADAAMIVWGMPILRDRYPSLIPILDQNQDGQVLVSEVVAQLQQDRESVRATIDVALQTWVTDEVRKRYPFVLPLFDTNEDGRLQLAEIEDKVDLTDPNKTANLIAIGLAFAAAKH